MDRAPTKKASCKAGLRRRPPPSSTSPEACNRIPNQTKQQPLEACSLREAKAQRPQSRTSRARARVTRRCDCASWSPCLLFCAQVSWRLAGEQVQPVDKTSRSWLRPHNKVTTHCIGSVRLVRHDINVLRRFWEALSGICSRTIQHPDSQVNRLCISPDKRFLAAAGHHTVKLYDIKSTNPNPLLTFEGHSGNITGVAFHCEGKWMVTSSEDGTVKIWETRTGSIQRSYSHGSPVNDVVIHPNQGEIISCDRSGKVRVWDLAENTCAHELMPEEDVPVSSVTVASDGTLLCAANTLVSRRACARNKKGH